MADDSRRIFYLSQDAYRAGSEIFLLRVMKWMGSHGGIRQAALFGRGGDLLEDFRRLCPCWTLPTWSPNPAVRAMNLASRAARLPSARGTVDWKAAGDLIRNRIRPDLIYVNSVMSSEILLGLPGELPPVLLHVHELDSWISGRVGKEKFAQALQRVTRILAVSQAVADNLTERHGVARDRIEVIHGFVPIPAVTDSDHLASRNAFRASLGIPPDEIVVGGCGTRDLRKGFDLFVSTAGACIERKGAGRIHFVWLGGRQDDEMSRWAAHDIERMGLDARLHLLPQTPDPNPFFAGLDVFFLSSREDPFPLVCLEAATHSVPIVAFDGAGGTPEFIRHDAGRTIPYGDVRAAADALAELAATQDLRRASGLRARERVATEHSLEATMPRVLEMIDRIRRRA